MAEILDRIAQLEKDIGDFDFGDSLKRPPEPEPEMERGIAGDIASNLARGVSDAAKMGGYALKSLDPDGGMEVLDPIGQGIIDLSKKADEWDIMQPDASEASGEESYLKKGIMSGVRAIPLTAAAMGSGIAAAAAAPFLGVGAVTAGTLSTLGYFGLGTYGQKYQEYKDAGIEDSEAQKSAVYAGLVEGGFEAVATYAGLKLFGVDKLISQPLKSSVKELLNTPMDVWAKRWAADTFLAEMPTEIIQNALGTQIDTNLGLQDEGAWKQAALDAIIPTFVISLAFGTGSAAMTTVQKRKLKSDLNNMEDDKKRYEAVAEIEKGITENEAKDEDGEVTKNAEAWANMAMDKIDAGEAIDLNESFIEYASQDEATLNTLREGVAEDEENQYRDNLKQKIKNLTRFQKPTPRQKEARQKYIDEYNAHMQSVEARVSDEESMALSSREDIKQAEQAQVLIDQYRNAQDQIAKDQAQSELRNMMVPGVPFNEGLAELEKNIATFRQERLTQDETQGQLTEGVASQPIDVAPDDGSTGYAPDAVIQREREKSVKALEKRQAEMGQTDRGPFQRGLEGQPDQTQMPAETPQILGMESIDDTKNLPFAGLGEQIDNSGIPVDVTDGQAIDDGLNVGDADFESEAAHDQRLFQQNIAGDHGVQDQVLDNAPGVQKEDLPQGEETPDSKINAQKDNGEETTTTTVLDGVNGNVVTTGTKSGPSRDQVKILV